MESQRVTPTSRTALLLGRVLRDVVVLLVQGTVLVLVSLPLGPRAPVAGVVLALVVIALLGAAFSAVSYALALTLTSEDAFAPLLDAVVLPVLLLSGILLPMSLAPGWLQAVSDVNPLEHVVDGVRSLSDGSYTSATAWWGFGLALGMVMAVLGWGFGVRRFRRESSRAAGGTAGSPRWRTRRLLVMLLSPAGSSVRGGRRARPAVRGRPGWC